MGRIVLSQAKDINHGKDCSITSERYKSWEGLFYHKRKRHNCEDVHSTRYEYELKHAVKLLEHVKHVSVCVVLDAYTKHVNVCVVLDAYTKHANVYFVLDAYAK